MPGHDDHVLVHGFVRAEALPADRLFAVFFDDGVDAVDEVREHVLAFDALGGEGGELLLDGRVGEEGAELGFVGTHVEVGRTLEEFAGLADEGVEHRIDLLVGDVDDAQGVELAGGGVLGAEDLRHRPLQGAAVAGQFDFGNHGDAAAVGIGDEVPHFLLGYNWHREWGSWDRPWRAGDSPGRR